MKNTNFISIIAFILISSLFICILSYFFGSFYLPSPTCEVSSDIDLINYTTVIIDAGHGGEDGGTSSANGLIEKDVNLSIARILCDMLKASGINVVMTREEDKLLYDRNTDYHGRKKKLDHAARLNIMKDIENAVFISIHMNSYTDPRYSGLQVWYSQNFSDSIRLADLIQDNNKKMLQSENTRRTKAATSAIFLLNEATCPAVLVECGFLSNSVEAAKFAGDEYRQQISFMLFCSILDFLQNRG